jgi:putative sterol carrier protein
MPVDISNINDRAGLAGAIDQRSDEDLNRSLGGRSAQVVMRVAESMKSHFNPARGPKRRVVIQYHVTTPDGVLPFHVILAGGACDVQTGVAGRPTITLKMTLPNYLRLASGKLGGLTAIMTGRVDVSGDLLLARKVQGWFE